MKTKEVNNKAKKVEKASNVGYKGSVTLSLLKGKKTYKTMEFKNNGSPEFFRVLCNAVIGNSTSSQMPRYIELYTDNEGTLEKISLVRQSYSTAKIENVVVGTDTIEANYYAVFEFLIPGSFLSNGKTIDVLRTYGSTNVNDPYLTEIDLTDEEQQAVTDSSSNLKVTWRMGFVNED